MRSEVGFALFQCRIFSNCFLDGLLFRSRPTWFFIYIRIPAAVCRICAHPGKLGSGLYRFSAIVPA